VGGGGIVVVVGGSVGKDNERRGGLIHLMKTEFFTDNREVGDARCTVLLPPTLDYA
jgi:hypothetical protein